MSRRAIKKLLSTQPPKVVKPQQVMPDYPPSDDEDEEEKEYMRQIRIKTTPVSENKIEPDERHILFTAIGKKLHKINFEKFPDSLYAMYFKQDYWGASLVKEADFKMFQTMFNLSNKDFQTFVNCIYEHFTGSPVWRLSVLDKLFELIDENEFEQLCGYLLIDSTRETKPYKVNNEKSYMPEEFYLKAEKQKQPTQYPKYHSLADAKALGLSKQQYKSLNY